jgi:hypothetical protein
MGAGGMADDIDAERQGGSDVNAEANGPAGNKFE